MPPPGSVAHDLQLSVGSGNSQVPTARRTVGGATAAAIAAVVLAVPASEHLAAIGVVCAGQASVPAAAAASHVATSTKWVGHPSSIHGLEQYYPRHPARTPSSSAAPACDALSGIAAASPCCRCRPPHLQVPHLLHRQHQQCLPFQQQTHRLPEAQEPLQLPDRNHTQLPAPPPAWPVALLPALLAQQSG
jgi:hypothetical protein